MHDIAIIRENAKLFDFEMRRRGIDACSELILALDEKKRMTVSLIFLVSMLTPKVNKYLSGVLKALSN